MPADSSSPIPSGLTVLGHARMRLRLTDRRVVEVTGRTPLSVAFDKLGATAARWAHLADALAAGGRSVDRTGAGLVAEVYPAAARRRWNLSPSRSVAELQTALASLGFADPSVAFAYECNEHAFDALVAALVARAVALNLTDRVRANSLSPQLRVGFTFPVLAAWLRLQALTSRPKLTDSLENLNSCVCTLAPALEEGSQRG